MSDGNCPPGEHDLQLDHFETHWYERTMEGIDPGLNAIIWVACETEGCGFFVDGSAALTVPDDADYPRSVAEEAMERFDIDPEQSEGGDAA